MSDGNIKSCPNLTAPRLVVWAIVSLVLLVFTGGTGKAQQATSGPSEDRDRAIQLYKQGDYEGASQALRTAVKRQKNDISAWHYLGLSLGQLGKKDDAQKSHEQAARIGEEIVSSFLNRLTYPPRALMLEAADSADQYLALSVNPSKKRAQEWRDRAEFLRAFATDVSDVGTVYDRKEVTTKPRVLSRPEPTHTEEARRNQVTGTVILRVIFAADARIRAIHVVAGLPDGLTFRAVTAAHRIKFIPATKDGTPVSMWMEIQYNFH